jgi:hypothetical protein
MAKKKSKAQRGHLFSGHKKKKATKKKAPKKPVKKSHAAIAKLHRQAAAKHAKATHRHELAAIALDTGNPAKAKHHAKVAAEVAPVAAAHTKTAWESVVDFFSEVLK